MSVGGISPELKRATLSGARWTVLARFVAELLAFAASLVLARLVTPAEFGDAAIALVVVALSAIMGTAGMSAPIVQRPELTDRVVAAVTVACLAAGSLLTLLTVAAAEFVAPALFGPKVGGLILLASPAWLLVAIGAPSQALLQRTFRFRILAVIEAVGATLGAGAAVASAVIGDTGDAVVIGALVLVGSAGLLSLAAAPMRLWRTDLASLRETTGFGAPVALSSLVYVAYRNIDYVILGARMSAANVGYYYRAYQLGADYQGKLSQIMPRISFPVFSRSSSIEELRAVRTRILRMHATVVVPLLAAFVAMAPIAVPWVFGSAWEPSVVPAQIMAVAGASHALISGTGPLMVAIGRPGALFAWNICELVVFAVLVFVLAPHGVTTVAVGVAAFGVFVLAVNQVVLLGPFIGVSTSVFVAEILPGSAAGAAVFVLVVGAREALGSADLHPAVSLFILSTVGLLAFVFTLRVFFRAAWRDLVMIARRVAV